MEIAFIFHDQETFWVLMKCLVNREFIKCFIFIIYLFFAIKLGIKLDQNDVLFPCWIYEQNISVSLLFWDTLN